MTEYELQYSLDGKEWQTAATGKVDKQQSGWIILGFEEPVQAKYVRLIGVHTFSDQGSDKHMAVAELRARVAAEIPTPSEKFTIKTSVNDETMGTVKLDSETGVYEKGANATLTAKAEEGYIFVNWTIDGEEVSKENPYIHTVETDATITANFEPIEVENEGWVQAETGWEYYENGQKVIGWKAISGEWYYFNADGVMETGWVFVGDTWYYLNASGAMETGWVLVGDTWYYMNTDGAMETGWVLVGDTWYYMNTDGAMETGWVSVGGHWYYLNADGAMETGWVSVGGHWYYLNADGTMETGWVSVGGHWYYLNADGTMETGWVSVDGYWYYLNTDGTMASNQWIDGYYVDASGKMA